MFFCMNSNVNKTVYTKEHVLFYTVYKITNKTNNKFYIGMHKTNNLDDGYMGSGKLIKAAVKKHLEESKKKISSSMLFKQKGPLNSQYGTCWITNGQENKKIKKEELDIWLFKGYYKGRVITQ
jgi:basic membrane lipoprotein Med (substrate-binding protein (PBP1-ABC) superfamily)